MKSRGRGLGPKRSEARRTLLMDVFLRPENNAAHAKPAADQVSALAMMHAVAELGVLNHMRLIRAGSGRAGWYRIFAFAK